MRSITMVLLLAVGLGLTGVKSAHAEDGDFADLIQVFVEAALAAEDCDCEGEFTGQPEPLPMQQGYVGPGYQHHPSQGGYEVFGTQENYGSWDHMRSNGGHTGGSNSWNNSLTNSYGGSSGDFGYVCTDSGCVTY